MPLKSSGLQVNSGRLLGDDGPTGLFFAWDKTIAPW
jgi:hypothetical protein